jgi:hypothetical protein
VDDFVRELARSAQATFGLHRFSFTQLAARLAVGRLAGAGIVPGTAIGAEAVAVRAAYEAQTRHELEYFAPVAKFPGFARATAATIGELRAASVATKNLKRLDESGPDNAALLERFEQEMKEVSVADRTVLFRTALVEVRAGAELAKHPLLLLDVPIHSAIEKEFVAALAAASQNVLITCLAGERQVHARAGDRHAGAGEGDHRIAGGPETQDAGSGLCLDGCPCVRGLRAEVARHRLGDEPDQDRAPLDRSRPRRAEDQAEQGPSPVASGAGVLPRAVAQHHAIRRGRRLGVPVVQDERDHPDVRWHLRH